MGESCCSRGVAVGLLLLVIIISIVSGLEQKLDIADQELNALTFRVKTLSDRLQSLETERNAADFQASRLSRRLDRQQGVTGSCKKGFFPCGPGPYGAVQCVRDYLVCDGSADCKSGADEADDICKAMPFTKPLKAAGRKSFDNCRPSYLPGAISGDQSLSLTMPPSNVIPWFPSRPKLVVMLSVPLVSNSARLDGYLVEVGYYNYATGDLILNYNPLFGTSGHFYPDSLAVGQLRYTGGGIRAFEDQYCDMFSFAADKALL